MKLHKLPNGDWIDVSGAVAIETRFQSSFGESSVNSPKARLFVRVNDVHGRSLSAHKCENETEAADIASQIAAIVNAAHEHRDDSLLPEICVPLAPALFRANYSTGEVSRVPPHQQRVYEEKAELDSKIRGLSSFIESHPIFPELPEDERIRMVDQRGVMSEYSRILKARIAAF